MIRVYFQNNSNRTFHHKFFFYNTPFAQIERKKNRKRQKKDRNLFWNFQNVRRASETVDFN